MKIHRIAIYQSPIKLREPFVTSLGEDTHANNVVVKIETDQGIIGFGECNPFLPISGESMPSAFVVAQFLAKALIGKNPLELENNSQTLDSVIFGNASIKSAFDIALYDIASQHAGMPLYAFLGGNNQKKLVTDYTVSVGSIEKMVKDAEKIIERGFTIIKVKLGKSPEKDVSTIKEIRRSIGNDVPIRVDANQGWSKATAIDILYELGTYNIQHCEEPIPRYDFMDLPEIKKTSPIPIMADESCCDHHDAKRLIALNACDRFNIKLGKSSGIFKAMKMAKLAEEHNIMVQVGGFLESRLGFTASAHFALACNTAAYFDFDTPLMFVEDPVAGGITYGSHGEITVPEQPGLGASLPDEYLQQLERIIVQ